MKEVLNMKKAQLFAVLLVVLMVASFVAKAKYPVLLGFSSGN
jgi:hypothetical protein